MTETGFAIKKITPQPSVPEAPAEKAAPGYYQLYNDTGRQVSVFLQEYWNPKAVFDLAPGATSDQFEGGHEMYFLLSDSGQSKILEWDTSDASQWTCRYHFSGWPHQDVNNVSSFQ
ncbi:hypothetical protein AB4305_22835 [Nocardia sp. 2YAB30]|uniref:hypothetical protein n=1 Tax=unclassified Nocardia TaxID=2637762 RepID=UPI003F9CB432